MPRNGSGVFNLAAGYAATTGATATATQHNAPLEDIAADLNAARPISAGGTGATTAALARDALGLTIGTNVQAYNAKLQSLSGLTGAPDRLPYLSGTSTFALATFTGFARTLLDDADAATARGTLGLGTIATQSAASVAITGGSIAGITDLAVADGGTGASTAANARTNLGLGTAATATIQTSATDNTAGRVLVVGANGLGISIQLTSGDNLNSLTATGFYTNPTSGNTPGNNYPVSAAGSLIVNRDTDGRTSQLFMPLIGTTPVDSSLTAYFRMRGTVGWSGWIELTSENTVGAHYGAIAADAVGSHAFLAYLGGVDLDAGDSTSGANLVYTGVNDDGGFTTGASSSPSGTWRAMGKVNLKGAPLDPTYATLFQRIA
jgi:hypothetical protein